MNIHSTPQSRSIAEALLDDVVALSHRFGEDRLLGTCENIPEIGVLTDESVCPTCFVLLVL